MALMPAGLCLEQAQLIYWPLAPCVPQLMSSAPEERQAVIEKTAFISVSDGDIGPHTGPC